MENMIRGYITLLSIGFCLSAEYLFEEDYCSGEHFEPKCQQGELIIMNSAFYGQMEVGRCITTDLGYVGCKSDVLEHFDQTCSGRRTCHVQATDVSIPSKGGCMQGLLRYLHVTYYCKQEQEMSSICRQNIDKKVLDIQGTDVYISSTTLKECIPNDRSLKMMAHEGQVLNVSVITFCGEASENSVIGSLIDSGSGEWFPFSGNLRYKHLLVSSSNEIEINVQEPQEQFILNVKVSGCPNMEPPQGAWMTRKGNQMDVGCHSGSKSWSLECQNNQWIGSIGQCGESAPTKPERIEVESKVASQELTIDVIVFGISSLLILSSAVMFLTGVCILQRKLKNKSGDYVSTNQPFCEYQPSSNTLSKKPLEYDMYMNAGKAPATDSVKYFVLEDSRKA